MDNLQQNLNKIGNLIHECVIIQKWVLKQGESKKQNALLADAYSYLKDAQYDLEDTIRRLEAYAASE